MRKTVTLPASYAALLTQVGCGNLSEGIRLVVEQARDLRGRPWFDVAADVASADRGSG